MIKPSKNFDFSEFVVSADYPELAAQITLTEMDKLKITLLCTMILQPIRYWFDAPVVIISGKRSEELNREVKGAKASDHLFLNESAAVDFTIPGVDMAEVYLFITEGMVAHGQCLYYPKKNFIHVSLPSRKYLGMSDIMP